MKVSFSCLAHRLGVLYYFCKHVVYTCAAMPFFNKVFILFYLAAQLTPITGWLGSYKKCSVLDVWENPNGENLCNLIKTEDPIHRGDRQRKKPPKLVHTSCKCDTNFDVTILQQLFCICWLVLNSCKAVVWNGSVTSTFVSRSQEVFAGSMNRAQGDLIP